eukprot:251187_1
MLSKRKKRRVELGAGTGIIGQLYPEKGYGFIIQHSKELDDLFFHFSEYPIPTNITSGTQVSYDCVQNKGSGKYKAKKIRILKNNNNINSLSASYNQRQHPSNMNNQIKKKSNSPNNGIQQNQIHTDRPRLGCFKLVKKDVTERPMFIPVLPLNGLWKTRKQFV